MKREEKAEKKVKEEREEREEKEEKEIHWQSPSSNCHSAVDLLDVDPLRLS